MVQRLGFRCAHRLALLVVFAGWLLVPETARAETATLVAANQADAASLVAQWPALGSNPIVYSHLDSLVNPVRYLVQGDPVSPSGCRFAGSATFSPSSVAREEQGVALNPRTCMMLEESGALPLAALQTEIQSAPYPFPCCESGSGSGKVVGAAGARTAVGGATEHSFYTDPLGIRVNQVLDDVTGFLDGTCAIPSQHSSGYGGATYFFAATGWSGGAIAGNYSESCSLISHKTIADFQNSVFCKVFNGVWTIIPFFPVDVSTTDVSYGNNAIGILPNATYLAEWSHQSVGGCSGLLDPHHIEVPNAAQYEHSVFLLDRI
jgi:hypothetical protein